MSADETYSVKQVAKLSGVSVRTLHVYDEINLLKPSLRSRAGYRVYTNTELLRLQQILFYKELGIALKDIREILDSPGFNLVTALESHKKALTAKRARIGTMLKTIDKTIQNLKHNQMLNSDELYDGLSREQATTYRNEAVNAYGAEVVEYAEAHLRKLTKEEMKALVDRQKGLAAQLSAMKTADPASDQVQQLIHEHYINTRKLWGTENAADKQAETYKGLGKLYVTDERFTTTDGAADPEFAQFMSEAMAVYADKNLR